MLFKLSWVLASGRSVRLMDAFSSPCPLHSFKSVTVAQYTVCGAYPRVRFLGCQTRRKGWSARRPSNPLVPPPESQEPQYDPQI